MSSIVDDTLGVMMLTEVNYKKSDYALLLYDYNRWGNIQDEFDEWLNKTGAWRQGLVVYYNDPDFYVMMKLKFGK